MPRGCLFLLYVVEIGETGGKASPESPSAVAAAAGDEAEMRRGELVTNGGCELPDMVASRSSATPKFKRLEADHNSYGGKNGNAGTLLKSSIIKVRRDNRALCAHN